jgi:hypothetical protein
MEVFLGGTCANSRWRNRLIPKLHIDYFNPVVKNWTAECQEIERGKRESCDFVLYTLTRAYSTYSIAEAVDDSNKRPEKTIVCIFSEYEQPLTNQEAKHLKEVGKLVERNGGKYFTSLEQVANYLNSKVDIVPMAS